MSLLIDVPKMLECLVTWADNQTAVMIVSVESFDQVNINTTYGLSNRLCAVRELEFVMDIDPEKIAYIDDSNGLVVLK